MGYEQSDLLWHGKKIAGAAQRRKREGLLIQGSIQARSLPLTLSDWHRAMQTVARQNWGLTWDLLEPDVALRQRMRELGSGKYSRESYNQKR